MTRTPWWHRALAAIGGFKVAAGVLVIIPFVGDSLVRYPPLLLLKTAHALVYGLAGWVLVTGGERDRRAQQLGIAFLLTASAFADPALVAGLTIGGITATTCRVLSAVQPATFIPYFLWSFAGQFPRGPDFGRRYTVVRGAVRLSAAVALTLAILNLLSLAPSGWLSSPVAATAAVFTRQGTGAFWLTLFGLALPALGVLVAGRNQGSREERRRADLLVLGLVLCTSPTLVWVILVALVPPFGRLLPLRIAGFVLYPLLLLLPVWTAYAVRVHRALDVRLVARRAVQYALARQTILLAAAVPFAAFGAEVYSRRTESLAELLRGPASALLGALLFLSLIALRGQSAIMQWLDRRYFREQYDARQLLADLVERCRSVRNDAELADVLRTQLTKALHAESVRLLVLNEHREAFLSSDADVQPLPVSRPLLTLAEEMNVPFETDPEVPESAIDLLPEQDRAWVIDLGAKLCVPLKGSEGALAGLLLLGEKRSELPYSEEDRKWLSAVGAAAALALGSVLAGEGRRSGDPVERMETTDTALACDQCGLVFAPTRTACERCEGRLVPTGLPLIIAGKFRLVARIGDGAMGIVYRGVDVHLARAVAIKTLPRLQTAAASRLRREARVLASLSHPSLAAIYGVETWRGMPLLVLELLSGGTLASRIAQGPMPSAEALQMGVALADALGAVHRAGILHRDVKPSNIGFSADGIPKLLDFGVSRLLGRAVGETPGDRFPAVELRQALAESSDGMHITTTTADGRVVGTPLYLSPEALNANHPDPSFDLWSLCIVLYEAIAGRHPIQARSMSELMWRIIKCDLPDISEVLPGADPRLSQFFRSAFSTDRSQRPATAEALRRELGALLVV